jgi:FMN phosphatase YigB (HAD superfamily)
LIGLHDDLFAFSLNAIDVGAAKPEPLMFEDWPANGWRHNPSRSSMSAMTRNTMSSARAQAGFRTVWVNRTQSGMARWSSERKRKSASLAELESGIDGCGRAPAP